MEDKTLVALLRSAGCLNERQFIGDHGPLISYHESSREDRVGARWVVTFGNRHTETSAAWTTGHNKTFYIQGAGGANLKTEALDAAKRWAGYKYNVSEWAQTPFGGYAPTDVITLRLMELLTPSLQPLGF